MTSDTTPPRSVSPFAALAISAARGVAFFLGGFSLLNVLGDLRTPGFDANEWWIDLRFLPSPLATIALTIGGGVLAGWALRPARNPTWIRIVRIVVLLLLAAACANILGFYTLVARGAIRSGALIPFSACIAAALLSVLAATFGSTPKWTFRNTAIAIATLALCGVLFPVAQIVCFGQTDYRRPADAIVVLGARVYSDGSLSHAVHARARTGIDLYLSGLAKTLIFSGGPGDGLIDEPAAMKRYALARGVPESAIVLDPDGLNTERTAENTARILRQRGLKSALVVSHSWHLPRVKLAFQREQVAIYTVPAQEDTPLAGRRYLWAREVVGLWSYYLRPLWR